MPCPSDELKLELRRLLADIGFEGRQLDALATRLGFDGAGGTTLQVAAERHGYTRERVRQLEARAGLQAPSRAHAVPSLLSALEIVEEAVPDERRHVARLFGGDAPFDPAGVVNAARLLGVRTNAVVAGSIVTRQGVDEPHTLLVRTAAALAAPTGQVDIRKLARCTGIDPDRIRRLIGEVHEVRWLNVSHSRLAIQTARLERRVATVARKALVVARSLPFTDLEDALRRTFVPVLVPRRVLQSICDSLPWLRRDLRSSWISASAPLDRRRVLSRVELLLATIFESAGPVLSFTQAAELGAAAGLSKSTVGVFLPRTPILKQLRRGRYALRGHDGAQA